MFLIMLDTQCFSTEEQRYISVSSAKFIETFAYSIDLSSQEVGEEQTNYADHLLPLTSSL